MVRRKPVLALLCVTFLAPILFYTDRLSAPTSCIEINEFLIKPSARIKDRDDRKLLAVTLGSLASLKEKIRSNYMQNSRESDSLSVQDSDVSDAMTNKGFGLRRSVELKSRMLSAADESVNSKFLGGGFIKQVINSTGSSEKTIGAVDEKSLAVSGEQGNNLTDGQSGSLIIHDVKIRQIKDQLIRARVYLTMNSIRSNSQLVRELRSRIKEIQRALGEATKDSDLPKNVHNKMKAMEQTLSKGKQVQDECTNVVRKLRAMLHSTEDQLQVHRKQSLFLTQLAAKTLPKGLHCLSLRLSIQYYSLEPDKQEFPNKEKLENSNLFHYALFSDNVLAAAVVVNSTLVHAKNPEDHVFHIVTDRLNSAAMKMWFLANPPGNATIGVQNIEDFTWLNSSYSPVLKQLESQSTINYYFRTQRSSDSNLKYRNPKYLSILNHLRFYLPEVFPKLRKVVFLDDDIVVQKDLTGLWRIDLKGKVNGAVETCGESFHRFDRYLNFSNPLIAKNFDPRARGWAYGMNVFDLEEWKRQNITQIYHKWQNLNHNRLLWKLGSLPPGLITFSNSTFALSRALHVLGLGYNPNVNHKDIERAAVIHYNGNLKPWLEIGIHKYRNYWGRYIDFDQTYLRDCNISP